MFFIVPIDTDAPIYHWPIATVSIIVTNVVLFFATVFQVSTGELELEKIEWLLLQFDTVNPLQWITGSFMHDGFMHLGVNMVFLWCFGLVVEGKIGSTQFSILYMFMALLDGACVQIPMFLLGGEGAALGASGVIFGLMAIALIWAPENEMDCFYFVWVLLYIRFGIKEVRIVMLCGLFFALQIIVLMILGFSMSSEMLHMVGVLIGAPIGFLMLRSNWVDCEGWDIISRNPLLRESSFLCSEEQRQKLRQREREANEDPVSMAIGYTQPVPDAPKNAESYLDKQRRQQREAQGAAPQEPQEKKGFLDRIREMFEPERNKQAVAGPAGPSPAQQAAAHPDFNRLSFAFRQAVESSSLLIAMQTFQQLDQLNLATGIGDKTLIRYTALLSTEKKWIETLRPLNIVISHQGELADEARLRTAQIQLNVMRKPQMAAQTLSQILDRPHDQSPERQRLMQKKAQLMAVISQSPNG